MNAFWSLLFILYSSSLIASDIAVVTLAHSKEYRELVSLGVENKHAYCRQHGYDYIYCEETLDPSRHPAWSKILLVLKAFENSTYQWVVWLDADTLIMNQDIPLEDLIDERYHFIISKSSNGHESSKDWNRINSGVFFIKNCDWSRQFLTQAYAHTEFLSPPWSYLPFHEQSALIAELKKPEFLVHSKIVPQRFFNSFPIETMSRLEATYQSGDFLIHFAAKRGDFLARLFEKYSQLVVHDRDLVTLDQCHGYYGIHSKQMEGYLSHEQKEQFTFFLSHQPHIQNILMLGLNSGHCAEHFLRYCEGLKKLISVDSCHEAYISVAAEYLSRKYPKKFEFIKANPLTMIPEHAEHFLNRAFDLIYLDGNRAYEECIQDILNCQKLASEETILLIDDNFAQVKEAVFALQAKDVIEIKNAFRWGDSNGAKSWLEARYHFGSCKH